MRPGVCRRVRPIRHRATDPQPYQYVRGRADPGGGLAEGAARFSGDADLPGSEPATVDPCRSERRHLRSQSSAGQIRVLRPSTGCRLSTSSVFAAGLDRPFGISFYPVGYQPCYVYVAENSRVIRYPYMAGDLVRRSGAQVVVPKLPVGAGQLPGHGHWTRAVAFSASSQTMFVSVGSYSNVQQGGEDETDRAAILAFNPDGSNRRIFASGLRNPVSLASRRSIIRSGPR